MGVPKGSSFIHTQKISDAKFIAEFPKLGAEGMARKYGMYARGINSRRRRIEMREGVSLAAPKFGGRIATLDRHPASIQLGIQNGHVLVGSDAHYHPGITSTAHTAFLEFIREYKPKAVIQNGDVADFPTISKHAPIAWESRPTVAQEIDNLKAMLSEIEKVAKGARLIHPLGNHDARFETRLATIAPEYAKIHGVHLKDHLPQWECCWTAIIDNHTVIKHRFKSGRHAPENNTLWSGRTMITGHLHAMKVEPLSDYNGTRWGVDCGTMADPYGPQFFNYTELNPVNWRSGFTLLTLKDGRLLWPEQIWVSGPGTVQFRGKEWSV